MLRSKVSTLVSRKLSNSTIPAQLTSISTGGTFRTAARVASTSARSTTLRSKPITTAPRSAKSFAVASPIPLAAPVTSTRLPTKSPTFPVMSRHPLFQPGLPRHRTADQTLGRGLVYDQFVDEFAQQHPPDDIGLVRPAGHQHDLFDLRQVLQIQGDHP